MFKDEFSKVSKLFFKTNFCIKVRTILIVPSIIVKSFTGSRAGFTPANNICIVQRNGCIRYSLVSPVFGLYLGSIRRGLGRIEYVMTYDAYRYVIVILTCPTCPLLMPCILRGYKEGVRRLYVNGVAYT